MTPYVSIPGSLELQIFTQTAQVLRYDTYCPETFLYALVLSKSAEGHLVNTTERPAGGVLGRQSSSRLINLFISVTTALASGTLFNH